MDGIRLVVVVTGVGEILLMGMQDGGTLSLVDTFESVDDSTYPIRNANDVEVVFTDGQAFLVLAGSQAVTQPNLEGVTLFDIGGGLNLLFGGDGNDRIQFGSGDDYVRGGSGADEFLWVPSAAFLGKIYDFTQGEDVIDLSALHPSILTPETLLGLLQTVGGVHTRLFINGDRGILIRDITVAELTLSDFVFSHRMPGLPDRAGHPVVAA